MAIADGTKGDLAIRADARFALAQTLMAEKGDPARAVALATRAAGDLESVGLPEPSRKVRGWLAENGQLPAGRLPDR